MCWIYPEDLRTQAPRFRVALHGGVGISRHCATIAYLRRPPCLVNRGPSSFRCRTAVVIDLQGRSTDLRIPPEKIL